MSKPSLVITRREFVGDSKASHDDYYAQFVTEQTLRTVENAFDSETLLTAFAEDRNLNSIPLGRWHALVLHRIDNVNFIAKMPYNRALVIAAGDTVTRATLVCIAKRAARMLVEREMSRAPAEAA